MTKWRRSSRSGTSGGDCVEVAALARNIGVRDSKDPEGPRLALSPDAWRTLVERLKHDAPA
ncbi:MULTISPECIES: DUF397 domain-containing protein [Actinomadura]|uniref:DUF397 domain-containing protein n=1 Tax=Actinomadura yumaensis TaxID=111807 RepID=A0ABW2CTE4_9ACTN|nr:DUF397 domain-containing protein [Actinomadura sp. J1-007]MWK35066.1 DUF397 domain-containing protein [Actinomadura sp. J1-007]